MWVWPQLVFGGSPPSPIIIGGPFPQAKPLPSLPSPSLFPPPPLALFARLREGAAQAGGGGGRGPRAQGGGGGGPPSGTWGQTHIWGYSIPGIRAPGKASLPGTLGRHCLDLVPTFRAGCFLKSRQVYPSQVFLRAALLGTNLRDKHQSAFFCGFLRFFCRFLRKSAVFCENPNALFLGKGENDLQKCSVCPLRLVPLSAP